MVDAPFVLFVNGTLMRGLELHANLGDAVFLGEAVTMPSYRLYSIADRHPGMFEVNHDGVSVCGELYEVPPAVWQRVRAGEPADLYLGPVHLADGRVVSGILYPRELAESRHRDISDFGSWRDYISNRSQTESGRHLTETKLPLQRYQRGLSSDSDGAYRA